MIGTFVGVVNSDIGAVVLVMANFGGRTAVRQENGLAIVLRIFGGEFSVIVSRDVFRRPLVGSLVFVDLDEGGGILTLSWLTSGRRRGGDNKDVTGTE